jgi:hypothetical protein
MPNYGLGGKEKKKIKSKRKRKHIRHSIFIIIIFWKERKKKKKFIRRDSAPVGRSLGRFENLRGQKVMSDILRCHEKEKLKLTDSFPSVLCYWIYLSKKGGGWRWRAEGPDQKGAPRAVIKNSWAFGPVTHTSTFIIARILLILALSMANKMRCSWSFSNPGLLLVVVVLLLLDADDCSRRLCHSLPHCRYNCRRR